jgi:hypothetical protein
MELFVVDAEVATRRSLRCGKGSISELWLRRLLSLVILILGMWLIVKPSSNKSNDSRMGKDDIYIPIPPGEIVTHDDVITV